MLTVGDIYACINSLAPFDTQADFDNSGLLAGDPVTPVGGIHVALDITTRVLDEAEAAGANLLLSHHPLMFSPRKSLAETDPEARILCRLIRSRLALISAHTNWDQAPGGINDVLAARCGLQNVTGEGYWRVGDLAQPVPLQRLAERLGEALHTTIRVMSAWPESRLAIRMAVSGGAGSEFFAEGLSAGANVFLTGEMKHHHALSAVEQGMAVLEAGHFATEEPGIFALADRLAALMPEIRISKSQAGAYAPPAGIGGSR